MEEDYKVVISLSHNRISYDYWQKEGENKLFPLPGGPWPTPLAFYASPSGVLVGQDALKAVKASTENAFDRYFDILGHNRTYSIGSQTREIRNLLLDASELVFKDFFQDTLYGSKGTLSDNRASMPLIIVYESDISSNEKALVNTMFTNSGYQALNKRDYNDFIAKYISRTFPSKYNCEKVLVVWSESEDLSFTLFNARTPQIIANKTYKNLGVDPRLKLVENLIWEKILGQNNWLQKEKEAPFIHAAALKFLNSNSPLVNERIILSDGESYNYSLNRVLVENIPVEEEMSLRTCLNDFLEENREKPDDKILLLLRGNAAENPYFERKLCKGFSKVVKTDKQLRENVMKMVLDSYEKPIPSYSPKEQNSTSDSQSGDTESYSSSSSGDNPSVKASKEENSNPFGRFFKKFTKSKEDSLKEKAVQAEKDSKSPDIENQNSEKSGVLSSEEKKQIRLLLFDCKQEAKKGNKEEASDLLERAKKLIGDAYDQLPESTLDLLKEGESLISSLSSHVEKIFKSVAEKLAKVNLNLTEQSERKGSSVTKSPPPLPKTPDKPQIPPQAFSFLQKRDFIKAKEVFRNDGNEEYASLCSELNRAHRQYKILQLQYTGYVKSGNVSGAASAIKEIERYIVLLRKLDLDVEEETALMNRFNFIR